MKLFFISSFFRAAALYVSKHRYLQKQIQYADLPADAVVVYVDEVFDVFCLLPHVFFVTVEELATEL